MRGIQAPKSRVCIVILTWNKICNTLDCLESVGKLDYAPISVLVVDNGSTDDTVAQIHAQYPAAMVLENGKNLGYAEGNNVGTRYALEQGYEYILVLNNDTVLAPDCLIGLVTDLQAHPEAAANAPKSYFYDSPQTVYYAGGRINGVWQTTHRGYGEQDTPDLCQAGETQWLAGCAILMRASALKKCGLFDPRFFVIFEDVDWSTRARQQGFTLRYVAEAKLWHKASQSFGSVLTPFYQYYYNRNRLLWIERNTRLRQKRWVYPAVLSDALGFTSRHPSELKPSQAQDIEKAIHRAIFDYALRRFGERTIPA